MPIPRRAVDAGSGTCNGTRKPRISPPVNWFVWKLIYAWPESRLGSCAVRVVALPSVAFHTLVNVPPTPVANGVTTIVGTIVSLKGEPKKPQTTGAVVV